MKIVYISKTNIPSKAANSIHIMKMCQAFANNGNEVWLCNLSEEGVEGGNKEDVFNFYAVKNCFNIVTIPILADKRNPVRFLFSHLLSVTDIWKTLKKIQPDLVYSRNIYSCFIASLAGFPVVAESHFPLWHGRIAAFSFRHLYKRKEFRRLIVITEELRKVYLEQYIDLEPTKIVVAHDAADPVKEYDERKAVLGDSNKLKVGYVGHLYKGKGVEVVAEIAPRMHDVEFHVIGGLEHDIQFWKDEITSENVIFHGFILQKFLSDYIRELDICLLPNQYEISAYGADSKKKTKNISQFTSPLKMFEYMAHAKPIIASDLPVLREVLDEETAFFVKPDCYQEWISAIDTLRDEKVRKKIGQKAKDLFTRKYTWKKRAENVFTSMFQDSSLQ